MFVNIAQNRVSPDDLEKLKAWAEEHRFLRSQWARENGIPLTAHMPVGEFGPLAAENEPTGSPDNPPINWYYLIRPNGQFIEMSFWKDEEQMIAWQQHPLDRELPKKIAPLLLEDWHDERYTVLNI